ncbi:MAG: histidine kinase [Ignavibacteria bacterium]|jgi:sensor histidine kinase YesM|nr:histidine kinase [Ignavibacteria bacterium]MCU7505143.1 histidine kinase [Ignavibacteria bacterium]MCU7518005.1 histidine kinase [Ignavibacteria bacterium]
MKIITDNLRKIEILAALSLLMTLMYHNWLPGHKVEFSGSYLLHFFADSLFNFVLILITWEANMRVNSWLDRGYKWEAHPIKRLSLQVSLNTVHSFLLMFTIISGYGFMLSLMIPESVRRAQVSGAYPVIRNSIYLLLVILLLYQVTYISFYFFRQWSSALVEKERLRRENISAQLLALQAQVNPHFLFNSLSSLVSLIEADKEQAVEFVQELASVYRYLLQQKGETLVKVCDEMEFIRSYIYLHKVRCGENLRTEINIDKKYSSYLIPPQTLQILAENAIKHNIVSSSKPLTLKFYTGENMQLYVENNLQKKISTQKHTGLGLKNISERYGLLGRMNIKIEDTNGIYRVSIPMIKPEEWNESTDY